MSERSNAKFLYETLLDTKEKILRSKELKHFDIGFLIQLEAEGKNRLNTRGWTCEYFRIINKDVFLQPSFPQKEWTRLIILAAARLGNTRLIDNIEIN